MAYTKGSLLCLQGLSSEHVWVGAVLFVATLCSALGHRSNSVSNHYCAGVTGPHMCVGTS